MKKILYGLLLATLLSIVMLSNVNQLEASGTIYIRADGTVEGTDKIKRDGDLYIFADDIYDSIIVEKDSIVIEGANHTVEGALGGTGITLQHVANVTVKNMKIKVFGTGIELQECMGCNVSETYITKNFHHGIFLANSADNDISRNSLLSNNETGIYLTESSHNFIADNSISYNNHGISISGNYNTISGNIVTDSTHDGIEISNCSNFIMSGNTIANNTDAGINAQHCSYSDLLDNTITNNGEGELVNSAGITMSDGYYINVIGNQVVDNSFDGLLGINCSNFIIFDNTFWRQKQNGVYLFASRNNNVTKNRVTDNEFCGIHFRMGVSNAVVGNDVTDNGDGIFLEDSSLSQLFNNNISLCYNGIDLLHSGNNTISFNNVTKNERMGVGVRSIDQEELNQDFWYNTITNNNILFNGDRSGGCGLMVSLTQSNVIENNTIAYNLNYGAIVNSLSHRINTFRMNDLVNEVKNCQGWINGSANNYYSDYEGQDQNGDGFGDTLVPHYGDYQPLVVPRGPIPVFYEDTRYDCTIDGSITISRFKIDNHTKAMSFNITGQGYINLTIPREYSDGFFKVFINDIQVPCMSTCDNAYASIYFESRTSSLNNVRIEAQMKFLGDVDGNGAVNIIDIAKVAKNFGKKLP